MIESIGQTGRLIDTRYIARILGNRATTDRSLLDPCCDSVQNVVGGAGIIAPIRGSVFEDMATQENIAHVQDQREVYGIPARRYIVITAVRDEEIHLRNTLECMVQQRTRPIEWIVVDDGSSDATGRIIDEYASRYPWIRGIHRRDRGFRKPGGGVVEAFNEGYRALRTTEWDYIVKFDGDLSFEPDYFERCLDKFAADPKLGVGGGIICYVSNGEKSFEEAPTFHVRGATKIYRRKCWEAIGGLYPAAGWDTFDEIKANSLGWTTTSFKDLHLVHHRVTGEADGFWQALVKYGRANYVCGYHPLFMVAKCVRRLARKPLIVGSSALMYGFVSGYLKRMPRVDDAQAIAYLRKQQMNRLMGRESIWD